MPEMTHWERIEAAVSGAALDHPPVSLWMHFPDRDQTAADLAAVTLDWQARFAFDFLKLMPPGDYMTIDWGAESIYRGNPNGTRDTVRFPVNSVEDWRRITPVPADRGMIAQVVEAAGLVHDRIGDSVPLLQTIFSPLTTAMKLSNGRVIDHLRERPDIVHEALRVITGVTREVVAASLHSGASGIFFATQCARHDLLSSGEFQEFGARYDLPVIEAAEGSRFTLLHIHGFEIMFDELSRYPVHALNWHDRRASPSLTEGRAASGKCVAGGIDDQAIVISSATEAAGQAKDALTATGGWRVMLAPGCVIPVATPLENIAAIVQTTRAFRPDPDTD
ncbi:uroporphyrinogen decarboxylase family protein [Nitrolancea hollandica]|uniref:Uroporphyrinogen decarboxylase (URO-D) n=1 Tax=Nitrolancea hollandica Lb TaxID=1129897 RepID=I4EIZ2_9BACT|nr:uroporphyrinogen decarboxylase family protein [Nitrolancea hollandica]CCF84654.1 Uroporphyrinogen decarboxylase (URO-D) [Nitrolancea hollandica Lb]